MFPPEYVGGLEFKEGENFNHRNILNISRIALKVSADASLRVTACQNLSLIRQSALAEAKGDVLQRSHKT